MDHTAPDDAAVPRGAPPRPARHRGVTLIELMIALVALGIAIAMLAASLPTLMSMLQDRDDEQHMMARLNQCAEAMLHSGDPLCDEDGNLALDACEGALEDGWAGDLQQGNCRDDFYQLHLTSDGDTQITVCVPTRRATACH